jgi:hypothetical protein
MAERLYTPEEANALLPHLAPTLVELRDIFEDAALIRAEIARTARGNGWTPTGEDQARILGRVAELLDRLKEWSVELRDIATGLVDFPAELEGGPAYLCWRLGEETVGHWHRPDEGFAGRHPL